MLDWSWVRARLAEGSTYQGLAAIVAGVTHFTVSPDVANAVATIAGFVISIIWVAKKEAKSPDAVVSPSAVQNGKNTL